MKVVVTGGAGYIGSILVPTLLDAGHHVTVVDNFMYRQPTLLDACHRKGFEVVRGDARDPVVLRPLLQGADAIIPLAAIVGAPAADLDQTATRTTNRDAIRTLLDLASPAQIVLYPTTNSGYGSDGTGLLCTEETPLKPISLYGVTKVEAEAMVLERENALTFRLATVFGTSPRMRVDLLVNDFVHRAVRDRAVVVFEGHFKRNYIHVRDVARVFVHALERFAAMRGRPYNVGLEDANLSKIELCEAIKRHVPNFVYVEAAIGRDPDQRNYIVSNARIAATGFTPGYQLDDGIRELIKGYQIIPGSEFGNK
jgi:nucleoside-diphosphate-sugar epimerase